MLILALALTILAVVLITLILYARWNYGTLEALNIPVVKPLHFLLGSTSDAHMVSHGLRDIEWMKKYGPVYGVYEGRNPQVHINDIEMIRQIMVKDYDHFSERRPVNFQDPILDEMPGMLPGGKWKVVRQLFSPQFSSGRIKTMSIPMNNAIKDFIVELRQQISDAQNGIVKNYDLRDGLFKMTTDLILRCVFNISVKMETSTGDHFVKILKTLMNTGGDSKPDPLVPWTLSFPFIRKLAWVHVSGPNPQGSKSFETTFKKLMEDRKRDGIKIDDFTDYIMELLEKVDTPEFKKNNVTEMTLMCQALIFFFAGQDQVTNLSMLLVYFVSQNNEIEKKIVQELDKVLAKNNGVIDHDCLTELTYLTACINEVLRLYPIFFRAERVCTKDWELDGVRIKKGMTVMIPIWAANRNPKYWENPEEFDPERFMPYNRDKLHAYGLTSFGHGPKNCTGIRFAYEILLLTAAHLYKELKFAPKDGDGIEIGGSNLFFCSVKPIHFHVTVRN